MNILVISLDRNIFTQGSNVATRMAKSGEIADSWHIVVFNLRKTKKYERISLADNVFVYPTNSISKFNYFFDTMKIVKEIYSHVKFDLIITQDPFELGILGLMLKRKYKVSLQLQIHTDFLSPYFKKESLQSRLRAMMANFTIKRGDCFRVVSKRIYDSIIAKYNISAKKIMLLPVVIETEKLKNAPQINWRSGYLQFDFFIVMASRITREKNIGMAINAMGTIVKSYPKCALVIIGDGPKKNAIVSLAKTSNVTNNIIFLGWQNDLSSYYKGADIFLLTSNYEGYCMSVAEAMSLGKPIVMTDVGLAGELLVDNENGVVVPIGNSSKLAQTILHLIEHKEERERLGKSAELVSAKLLSENAYMEEYKKLINICL